jgi:aldehyde decarbonylase
LRVRIVDGSGLATGVVLKSIPLDAKQVFLHTGTSKIARAVAMTLCGRGIQVYLYLLAVMSNFIGNTFVEHFPEFS